MRGLVATPDGWAARARAQLDALLLEQAHLEKKAAGAALAFLFRHPDDEGLQEPLAALAREELAHFQLVLAALRARGVPFGRQRPGRYAQELAGFVRSGGNERLLDGLLVAAVIEARSCERMRLLARELRAGSAPEPELAALYERLVAAEARHQDAYLVLARERFGPAAVQARLAELLAREAALLAAAGAAATVHLHA
jgi:tRNA-(ms[2]io[6]A)-hydroxylase